MSLSNYLVLPSVGLLVCGAPRNVNVYARMCLTLLFALLQLQGGVYLVNFLNVYGPGERQPCSVIAQQVH
jgi:hypothetical protein